MLDAKVSAAESVDLPEADAVDHIIAQWRVERPDLDSSAKHITGRIVRLASLFLQAFEESHVAAVPEVGMNGSDFGVLSPLRRAGEPFELTPTELARHRMITSGGMTAALDRLERRGWIVRVPNPNDRRGSLVRLTDAGRVAIDRAMDLHAETEQRLVSALGDDDARELQRILRQLLLATDPSNQSPVARA
jgi:DNA-binding MarR family transcriptional regulator